MTIGKECSWRVGVPTDRPFPYDPESDADEEVLSLDAELGGYAYAIEADGSFLLVVPLAGRPRAGDPG